MADALEILKAHAYGNDFLYVSAEAVANHGLDPAAFARATCARHTGVGADGRVYRTVFAEEMSRDYVRTARSKGAGDARVMARHVLPNALIPVLTNVVVEIPFLFTGSILLESFFGIPGLGSITVDAIQSNDFATLRVMVYLGALLFIAGQMLTDVAYTLVDPRVRLG